MPRREGKVIGYFAYLSAERVVCTAVDACVISGTSRAMEEYVAEVFAADASKAIVKKTRFGEILRGIQAGAAYAFDKESYARFYPLALKAGLPVAEADFDDPRHRKTRFFTVRPIG
jgi:hypothetical protein